VLYLYLTASLLAGLPSPEYFPFTSISADILPTDAFPLSIPPPQTTSSVPVSPSPLGWLWRRLFGNDDDTTHVLIPREPRDGDGGLNLATALQYGPATGLARTQAFIREFTERVYAPAYADWATLIDTGNTDGCACSSLIFLLYLSEILLASALVHCARRSSRSWGVSIG
jgi:aromatic amino acid aminotransferase I